MKQYLDAVAAWLLIDDGGLFCFDFQENAIRQVCGQRVNIQGLDFEKVKALLEDTGS